MITVRDPKNIAGDNAEETWDQEGDIFLRLGVDNNGI